MVGKTSSKISKSRFPYHKANVERTYPAKKEEVGRREPSIIFEKNNGTFKSMSSRGKRFKTNKGVLKNRLIPECIFEVFIIKFSRCKEVFSREPEFKKYKIADTWGNRVSVSQKQM